MNTTTALKKTSEHGGPIVLSAGVAMLAVALFASGHGPGRVEAGPPARVPAVANPPATGRPTSRPSPTPSPSTSGSRPAASVVAASARDAALPHTGSGGQPHAQARPPSTPQPSPAAAPCSGQALTVRLLRAACVSIGRGQ